MLTPELNSILNDLEIEVVDMRVRRQPGQTCAASTLDRILTTHGAGHLRSVLMAIVETDNNKRMLVAPVIWGMSDLLAAYPSWFSGAFLEAMDSIDLASFYARAKANRRAAQPRQAMATMLFQKLSQTFSPEKQGVLL